MAACFLVDGVLIMVLNSCNTVVCKWVYRLGFWKGY